MRKEGLRIILAHPERHEELLHEPGTIEELIAAGCLVQVSAALRRAGNPLPALHPVELVDASIRGLDAARLVDDARR